MQQVKHILIFFLGLALVMGMGPGTLWAQSKVFTIGWEELSTLDFEKGTMPSDLEALDGEVVRIPGYIVPLEGDEENITEFLLVPYFGACIHVPPPPPNQIVHVIMNKGFPGEIAFDPVWVTGMLSIGSITSELAEASFSLNGLEVVIYEF